MSHLEEQNPYQFEEAKGLSAGSKLTMGIFGLSLGAIAITQVISPGFAQAVMAAIGPAGNEKTTVATETAADVTLGGSAVGEIRPSTSGTTAHVNSGEVNFAEASLDVPVLKSNGIFTVIDPASPTATTTPAPSATNGGLGAIKLPTLGNQAASNWSSATPTAGSNSGNMGSSNRISSGQTGGVTQFRVANEREHENENTSTSERQSESSHHESDGDND